MERVRGYSGARVFERHGLYYPSKHKIQFVNVEDGVRLEVPDWGGSGRPIVLLAGLGFTAHVFDSASGGAHVVELWGASHFVFLSNESDVLRDLHAFLAGLRSWES